MNNINLKERGKGYSINFALAKSKPIQQINHTNTNIHNKDIDQVKNIVSTFRQGVLHKATKSKFKTSKNSRKFFLLLLN